MLLSLLIAAGLAACAPLPSTSSCVPQIGGGITEEGVVNKNCCAELTVIFARGTTESGNLGSIIGPPLLAALRASLGSSNVLGQGVDYPASIGSLMTNGAIGGPTMAALVKQSLSQCPSSKIVVSGYSQGAEVVHNAMSSQGLKSGQVAAAVLFGDPDLGSSGGSVTNIPKADVQENCAVGDVICEFGILIIEPAHLTYGAYAGGAAKFIINAVGL